MRNCLGNEPTRCYPPHLGTMYNEVCPPRTWLLLTRRFALRLFFGTGCALAGAQWGAAIRRERIIETVYRPDPELCEDTGGVWRRCPWLIPNHHTTNPVHFVDPS